MFLALLLTILTTTAEISHAHEENAATPEVIISKTEELKNLRELRPSIEKQQEEMKKKIEEQRLKFQEEMQKKREEIKKEVEDKIKEKKEMFEASREAFLQKKKLIRDENKQKILEKIDSMMNEVNTKHTVSMTEALNKFSGILDTMASKAGELKTKGADTTAFDAAMTKARSAIEAAKAKIAEQAAKDYTISISTEDALRSAVGETRSQLEADLHSVRDSVKLAKEAVRDVAKELVKLRKEVKLSITPKPSTVED